MDVTARRSECLAAGTALSWHLYASCSFRSNRFACFLLFVSAFVLCARVSCARMAYAQLPPVGWNLTTKPTVRGGRSPLRPVSTSFGKSHPTRSGASSSCVMGKQAQRLGPRASVPSGKYPQLVGISTKSYDQYLGTAQLASAAVSRTRHTRASRDPRWRTGRSAMGMASARANCARPNGTNSSRQTRRRHPAACAPPRRRASPHMYISPPSRLPKPSSRTSRT